MDWNDYAEIAEALDKKYPYVSADGLTTSEEELIAMVLSLPDFVGKKKPPDKYYITFIRNRWISLQQPSYNLVDDSPFI